MAIEVRSKKGDIKEQRKQQIKIQTKATEHKQNGEHLKVIDRAKKSLLITLTRWVAVATNCRRESKMKTRRKIKEEKLELRRAKTKCDIIRRGVGY